MVDRLLASPHYGERWARYWLDLARYAEEQRANNNSPYAMRYAYRYRDWVAEAFNQDLGYDRFIMQQIAGDLMSGVGMEGWSALGFLSLGPIYESDGGGKESKLRHRYDTMDDKIDTLSRAVLGLTVSCARCHDHKFDPIPTEDYYSLAGVFFNTKYMPRKWMVPSRVSDRYEYLEALLKDKKKCVDRAKTTKIFFQDDEVDAMKEQQKVVDALTAELEAFKETLPPEPEHVHGVRRGRLGGHPGGHQRRSGASGQDGAPPIPARHCRGPTGDLHARQWPAGAGPDHRQSDQSPHGPGHGQSHLAAPLRSGPGEHAQQFRFHGGGLPATRCCWTGWPGAFIDSGWSMKRMHREILLSSTYRQSSAFDRSNFAADGENRWLWRMDPRRLDVEAWRDGLLAVAGEQDLQIGGPPVEDILSSRRRTLYASIHRDIRSTSDQFLRLFDFPSAWLSRRPEDRPPPCLSSSSS